jgi:hypothetical protein
MLMAKNTFSGATVKQTTSFASWLKSSTFSIRRQRATTASPSSSHAAKKLATHWPNA